MLMTRFHTAVTGMTGAKRYGLAFLLGASSALALAPFYLLFILIPVYSGLLWLVFGARRARGAFAAAWWFGVGQFSAGLYWIANALLTDAARFGWLVPITILGLSSGLALFPGLAALASYRLLGDKKDAPTSGVGKVLVFAALWVLLEWLRGWVLTGFPWNLAGSVWAVSDEMMQAGSVVGVYGLSLLAILVAALPATLSTNTGWGGGARPTLIAAVVLVLVWGGGAVRLSGAGAIGENNVPDVRLRLVQPNISQQDKWKAKLRIPNLKEYIAMGAAPAAKPDAEPTHVIWSETAATFNLANDMAVRAAIAEGTPKGGLTITGAPRTTPPGEQPFKIWNSLYAINDQGGIVDTYDKHHLVPFGEYMPFRGVIGLEKLTAGATDFTPGPGPRTLQFTGLPPVAPLICYEVIFPGNVVDATDRPQWMLNLTNDAWYGISTGPYQHYDAARFRALEEGMPIVRVANTGISGIVDAYGRNVTRLDLGTKGTLDGYLPKALEPTIYSRFGNALALLMTLIAGGVGLRMGRLSRV